MSIFSKPVLAPRVVPDFKNMARLQSLDATGSDQDLGTLFDKNGRVTIYIPHLPETIELPRENSYLTSNSQIMPDGYHVYQSTSPVEIPIEFTLHAWDPLCVEGSNSLLAIGAALHALMLPASNNASASKAAPPASRSSSDGSDAAQELSSKINSGDKTIGDTLSSQFGTGYKFPPACTLRLMQAGPRGYGIYCVGFVKSATPTYHGPHASGPTGSEVYNLPTSATFKFTFVHNPAYTNQFGGDSKMDPINAYGPDVLKYFYNTRHLANLTGNSYSSIDELDYGRSADVASF